MTLSHIHVADVAEAIIKLLDCAITKRGTWNLCHPTSFHWTELQRMVERLLNRPVQTLSAPRYLVGAGAVRFLNAVETVGLPLPRFSDKLRDAQFRDWRCDGTKFYDELNYIPQRSLYEGLKEMVTP